MVITTDGLDAMAGVIGNSGTAPGYIAIGSGTTAANIADTTLEKEWDRNGVTSTDLTISKNVTWIGDFSSTEVSGLTFTEFGLLNNAVAGVGNIFNREVVGSIAFEGDRELQVQITYKYL